MYAYKVNKPFHIIKLLRGDMPSSTRGCARGAKGGAEDACAAPKVLQCETRMPMYSAEAPCRLSTSA